MTAVPAASATAELRLARFGRRATLLAALLLAAAATVLLALGVGAVPIAPGEIFGILASRLGLAASAPDVTQQAVFEAVRAPRVVLAFAAGAALGVSGAAIQGVFRNPLADPGLIGVTAGAALAAVAVIVLGPRLFGELPAALQPLLLPLGAFGGGLLATAIVYIASRSDGRVVVPTMLLAGVALGALAGAGVGWLTFISDEQQLRMLTFWTLGSAGAATWSSALPAAVLVSLAAALLAREAGPLNALALGEREARHLGFDPTATTTRVAVLSALAVGAATAACGAVGFIGLIAPHLLRLAAGPDHRLILPASALLGGTLLTAADTVARTAVVPTELPLGVVTAMIGGPFFFWLLLRDKRRRLQ